MRLTRVQIKNFRSLFDDGDGAIEFELRDGLNLLVGKNNCGKSNVLRAIALAMDPHCEFDVATDGPAQKIWSFPTVTLEFEVPGKVGPEKTLLKYADEYERIVREGSGATYASTNRLILQVQYSGSAGEYRRTERIKVRGVGNRQGPPEMRDKVIRQLRSTVHFVLLESGQSLESMLEGRFREILNSVIRDHLKPQLEQAREHRLEYVRKLQEDLLAPLSAQVGAQLQAVFPEFTGAELNPRVSSVEQALAEVGVQLTDTVATPLANKGTGVRGGVLLAMLRYLAIQSRRSMIFAVEEPEAFLHPAAQRMLAQDLVDLASEPNVTLVATSHSPFMVPRDERIKVMSLEKDPVGRTRLVAEGMGSDASADLLNPLFGDLTSAAIFGRATEFDPSTRLIVVVEGGTDQRYLETAATTCARPELLADVIIEPVDGTTNLLARFSQLLVVAPCPVVALLDNDAEGRRAQKLLIDGLKVQVGDALVHYGCVMDGVFDWEAEDLFPPVLVEEWLGQVGEDTVTTGRTKRPDDEWHYDVATTAKWRLAEWLTTNAQPDAFEKWITLLEELNAVRSRWDDRREKKLAYLAANQS